MKKTWIVNIAFVITMILWFMVSVMLDLSLPFQLGGMVILIATAAVIHNKMKEEDKVKGK